MIPGTFHTGISPPPFIRRLTVLMCFRCYSLVMLASVESVKESFFKLLSDISGFAGYVSQSYWRRAKCVRAIRTYSPKKKFPSVQSCFFFNRCVCLTPKMSLKSCALVWKWSDIYIFCVLVYRVVDTFPCIPSFSYHGHFLLVHSPSFCHTIRSRRVCM